MKAMDITIKDLKLFLKNKGLVLNLFLMPIIFIIVLPWAMSQSKEEPIVPLPVVNLDVDGEFAQELIGKLKEVEGLDVLVYELKDAQTKLEAGEIMHVLTIPQGFSQAVANDQPVALNLTSGADASDNDSRTIQLAVEGVAKNLSLKAHLFSTLELIGRMQASNPPEYQVFTTERNLAQAKSQWEASRDRPLVQVKSVYPTRVAEEEEISPVQVSVPGVAVLFVFLTAQTTALSIFTEKKLGSFRRLLAAPMSRFTLMMGKLLPNYFLTIVQMAFIFLASMFIFPLIGMDRFSLGSDILAVIVLCLVVALCSTSLGIMIVALVRTENQIGGLSSAALWLMGAVGGSFFPTFFLSGFLGSVGKVVPHYWANLAFNDLLVRGGTFADIGMPILALLGFTALFLVIGLWRFDFD